MVWIMASNMKFITSIASIVRHFNFPNGSRNENKNQIRSIDLNNDILQWRYLYGNRDWENGKVNWAEIIMEKWIWKDRKCNIFSKRGMKPFWGPHNVPLVKLFFYNQTVLYYRRVDRFSQLYNLHLATYVACRTI